MKARFPLFLQILTWLGFNLALIAAVAAVIVLRPGGMRETIESTVLERLQMIADQIAYELRDAADYESVVGHYADRYDLRLTLHANQDGRIAGFEDEIPEFIQQRLRPRGAGRGAEGPNAESPRTPPGGERPGPGREGPAGLRLQPPRNGPRPMGLPPAERSGPRGAPEVWSEHPNVWMRSSGAFIQREEDPGRWWVGIRIPVPAENSTQSRPGTLLAVSDSVWEFGSLFDLRPVMTGAGIVIVISMLFWLPLVLRMTQALKSMMRATGEIAEGRFETRVKADRMDEIGALGRSINRMAIRLDSLVNGQKKFLADIAHELGSPVGRLQVASSILEERVADDLKPRVADVKEEVDQMSELLAELLAFTKAGLQAREAPRQPVVLADAIEQAIAREAEGITVVKTIDPGLVVRGDANLLVKVLGNLVRNAIRYGGDGVAIEVRALRRADRRVEVQICDNGPGVPVDALDRLGEPFFRPDASRSRKIGGTGLGLSIVREAVTAMQGTIRFANAAPHGFIATITLPETRS